MILNISAELVLCRYDINEPPENWDSLNHSEYTEYSCLPQRGKKNQAGFYFFYDNCETAMAVANVACSNKEKDEYWLTTSKTKDNLAILDFSQCTCLHDILDVLDTVNIKVYDSQMKVNGFEAIWSMSDLRDHNRLTRVLTKVPELIEVCWFGQLLTDFENGKEFKRLIDSARLEIDGYRWCEEYNPHGLTYCLFSPEKLGCPEKGKIECKY